MGNVMHTGRWGLVMRGPGSPRIRSQVAALSAATLVALGVTPLSAGPAQGAAAPVGQGFSVTASDLKYILAQIKIAERHAYTQTPDNPCGTLVGTGPDQIPSPLVSKGLRTVDGSCNNLQPGQETFGSADQVFPRLGSKSFRDAEGVEAGFFGPGSPAVASSSYTQKSGSVFDSEPRTISNLIVDQTSTNPAAVAAAGFPVRSQGDEGVKPCTSPGVPTGCVPQDETLFIPNVTTDVGLSPPYNSLFTLFGQFFDHGIDQTVKGGGTVYVPMKSDDPLILGPDHAVGGGDDLPPELRFMVLTRGKNQPGPDKVYGTADDVQDALNTDSPWVDQSQTYTSHASHQVFLREYESNADGKPVSTGRLLGGPAGREADGMATWATVKAQARDLLGLQLTDMDVLNVPMIAADPYGNFIPGPARGLPQYVTAGGLVEGDTGNPVPVPADVRYFETPFLTDIAHNADPSPQDTDHNPRTPKVAPTPDDDTTASADFANQPAGTYDDEMLDAHFAAGDGRVNENIGLTAIHQVFHSEHDRLVADVERTLGKAGNEALLAAYRNVTAIDPANPTGAHTFTYGERLFQAARFVTEMEYQHLVFEEFARKVQPAINPFEPFAFTQTELNPAISAEFAHAVYRFGHSMLTETISRRNEDKPGSDNEYGTPDDIRGSTNDISLLDGFLNPPAYTDGGSEGPLTSEEAAGSIVMGMTDQTGNELDEFVTDTLRNKLLGLPLDLATVNMTRARSEGVPPLNVFRRDVFTKTHDAAMKPYTNWVELGESLKHPESLVNFVAAYGRHPSITSATTLAGKREAARLIVSPDVLAGESGPADAAAFMNSVPAEGGTDWSNDGTHSRTGLDDIDLWVGGLAEQTNLFGGLLGSTFNYVFENQMTDLQNGDRLYYLARTPGMNLRTQLEGNSFGEMIMRNTNAHTLKADVFATADCKFELKNLAGTSAGFTQFGNRVADDTSSECMEPDLLLRLPDGTIKYRARNTVDPAGINGQSVYNGTPGVDRLYGGNDSDTFWGGLGNDVIEGGDGADIALGGEGDDILTDLNGDDVPKGGPGNDAIDAGPGLDIVMGGEGKDFTNGGANLNETFGGADDDFIMLGESLDAAFGDSGDDWEEGGNQPDLMQGDSGNLFFLDDSQQPGSDILIGQGGDDDYDMEGGDDIGLGGPGIEKVAGASGYDWEIGIGDPQPQDMDLQIPLAPLDILQVGVRDKFNEVEALSGGDLDDKLRGDDIVPSQVGGGGFIGCDVLDQHGLDRIEGLDALVPDLTTPLASVVNQSASKDCPILSGPVWGDGNILLGGGGSDLIEGRGADDIIDGDRYLNVRLSVRNSAGDEIGSASANRPGQSAMTSQYLRDADGALTGPTLQEAVFAGTVNPGDIVAVREIKSASGVGDVDRALFSDVRVNYAVTTVGGNGRVGSPGSTTTVRHLTGTGIDGVDTLRNIEKLVFADSEDPATPTDVVAVAGNQSATVTWTAPGNAPVTDFTVKAIDAAGAQVGALTVVPGSSTTVRVTGLTNATAYRFQVRADNESGRSAYSAPSNPVTPAPSAPDAPRIGTAVAGPNGTATVAWTAPADNGGSAISGYSVRVVDGSGTQVGALRPAAGDATSLVVSGLAQGSVYRFQVSATNPTGTGAYSALSNTVTALGPAATVAARTPAPGATGVGVGGNVTATFDRAVTGVTTTTFRLRNMTTNAVVPAAVSLSANGLTATLNPGADLANSTVYRAELVGGAAAIRTLSGNVALADTSWSFTTSADPAPTLTARSPAAGATRVNTGVNVTATFSERVQGATTTSVTLRNAATNALVAATVSVNTGGNGRVITLNPNATLARNTLYRATFTGGPSAIRDLANTPFAGATWTFRTR